MFLKSSALVFLAAPQALMFLADPCAAATTFTYTTIAYPGAAQTVVSGINASGTVAGTYTDSSGNTHAFTWSAGKFTTIASPSGYSINAAGINDAGSVTGAYQDASGFSVGYIYSKGALATITSDGNESTMFAINTAGEAVGSTSTYLSQVTDFSYLNGTTKTFFATPYNPAPSGINDSGSVVGNYTLNGGRRVGYLFAGGKAITLLSSGTTSVSANAINASGLVVGSYVGSAGGATVGFEYNAGAITTLTAPGFTNAQLTGIDTAGEIIGSAWNKGGAPVGFALSKGVFSSVTPPGATSVSLTGINSAGTICGNFAGTGGTKGFVAVP